MWFLWRWRRISCKRPPARIAVVDQLKARFRAAWVDRYIIEVWGGCLGSPLPDGTSLRADPRKRIEPMSLVSVVLRKGKGPHDRFMREAWADAMGTAEFPNCMCKVYLNRIRYTVDGREVVLLGQLYPPAACFVGIEEVEAMHRIVGSAGHGTIDLLTSDEEKAAFDLIAPFRGKSAIEPTTPTGARL